MGIRDFFLPAMKTEIELKNIATKCGLFFFLIAAFYLLLSLFKIGNWDLKTFNSYLLIVENAFIGFGLINLVRPIVRFALILSACLIVYLFAGGYPGKIISIISLIILIYADATVFRYHSLIKS